MKLLISALKYLFAVSPIIITSFFVWNPTFPAWANTMLVVSIVTLFVSLAFVYQSVIAKRKTSMLTILLLVVGLVVGIGWSSFVSSSEFWFALFGKGLGQWTGMTIFALFAFFAAALELSGKQRKVALYATAIAAVVTLVNYLVLRFLPSIGNYTGYANIPMISFGRLFSYPLIFVLVMGSGVWLSEFFNKKGIIPTKVGGIATKIVTIIVLAIVAIWVFGWSMRMVAAKQYVNASIAYANGDVAGATLSLDRAIKIQPFDSYYLAKAEILANQLSQILQSDSTNTEQLAEQYSNVVQQQIAEINKAIKYDPKNPQGYLALGRAYEYSMVLPGAAEGAYSQAIANYNKAAELVADKDTVDTIKARVAFGAEKESEALSYLDNALNVNPSSTPALYIYSQYYASKQNIDTAVEYAERAVVSDPSNQDLHMQLGLLYANQNRFGDAALQFNAVVQINPNNAVAAYYLALSLIRAGDLANAEQATSALEKAFPESEEVKGLRQQLEATKAS